MATSRWYGNQDNTILRFERSCCRHGEFMQLARLLPSKWSVTSILFFKILSSNEQPFFPGFYFWLIWKKYFLWAPSNYSLQCERVFIMKHFNSQLLTLSVIMEPLGAILLTFFNLKSGRFILNMVWNIHSDCIHMILSCLFSCSIILYPLLTRTFLYFQTSSKMLKSSLWSVSIMHKCEVWLTE